MDLNDRQVWPGGHIEKRIVKRNAIKRKTRGAIYRKVKEKTNLDKKGDAGLRGDSAKSDPLQPKKKKKKESP